MDPDTHNVLVNLAFPRMAEMHGQIQVGESISVGVRIVAVDLLQAIRDIEARARALPVLAPPVFFFTTVKIEDMGHDAQGRPYAAITVMARRFAAAAQ